MRSCKLYTWWILMDQATIQRKIIWTPFEAKLDVAGFGNRSMDDRQKVFVWILLCWCSLVCNKNAIEVLCDRSFEIHIVHLVDSEIPGWFPPKNTNPNWRISTFADWGSTQASWWSPFLHPKVISVFPGELLVMLIESLGWKTMWWVVRVAPGSVEDSLRVRPFLCGLVGLVFFLSSGL